MLNNYFLLLLGYKKKKICVYSFLYMKLILILLYLKELESKNNGRLLCLPDPGPRDFG